MKSETVRQQKEQNQVRKLKVAYDSMLVYEQDRQQDKQERSVLKVKVQTNKLRDFAVNFQQAEKIRQKERDLKQSKFFNNELTKLNNKDQKKQQQSSERS